MIPIVADAIAEPLPGWNPLLVLLLAALVIVLVVLTLLIARKLKK